MPPAGLPAEASGPELARLAWQRLQPERWPLPPDAFPAEAALVGGAVRDALLNRLAPEPDLDLVVAGDAVALCQQLQRRHGGSAVVLDAERSIARLVLRGWSIDLARQEGNSLEADLQRRDYTINAMALPLAAADQLLDPHAAVRDLRSGQLVAVAEANLVDDPLRLLRGVRLAAELDFGLDQRSLSWIAAHASRLHEVAGERVLAELEKLSAAPQGAKGLIQALELQLLPAAADRQAKVLLRQLGAERASALPLNKAEREAALGLARLAACLDRDALQQLHSSRRLQQQVERLRRWQRRLGTDNPAAQAEALSERERLQLQRDLEQDLPALLLTWSQESAAAWLARWRDPNDPLFHPRAAIDGGSLQRELGLPASPQLGALLEHLMLEQAFGRLQGRTAALKAAHIWLQAPHPHGEAAPRRD